jgi:hypothetical protein
MTNRPFRLSEQSYNDELFGLNEVLRYINSTKEDLPLYPKEGAIWLDKISGDLKYYNGSAWRLVHENKFKLFTDIMSATPPESAYDGQLWISNGILKYFSVNANQWIPIKSLLADSQTDIDLSSFEPFLLINQILPSGDTVSVKSSFFSYMKEEEFTATANQKTFTLSQGAYKPNTKSLEFYVNGIRIPYSGITEDINGKNIDLVDSSSIVDGDKIVIVYKVSTIIEDIADIKEEEFIATLNQKTFTLSQGIYQQGLKAVKVYINGCKIPHSGIIEFETGNKVDIVDPSVIVNGTKVVINYRVSDATKITDSMEEEFIATRNQSQYLLVQDTFIPGLNLVEAYVNGCRVPYSGIIEGDDGVTVALIDGNAIDAGDKVVINYKPQSIIEEIINLTKINGDDIRYVLKNQFLLPSTEYGKFFIEGSFSDDCDIVSQVALQFDVEKVNGKKASAVHVNPAKITGLKKRVIKFDKLNPIINVPEYRTEFYGFSGGLGRLLTKDSDIVKSDYFSAQNGGIILNTNENNNVANTIDFVVAVSYEFGDASGIGKQVRERNQYVKGTGVYVGKINTPIAVFIAGKFLAEDINNYTYNKYSGFIKFSEVMQTLIADNDLTVTVIPFSKKQQGKITSLDATNKGIINISGTFVSPIIFLNGFPLLSTSVTFNANKTQAYVDGAAIENSYAVVEGSDILVQKGKVTASKSVPNPAILVPLDFTPILFVDGVLIETKDLQRKPDRTITIENLISNQDFMLLDAEIIFEGAVEVLTIPLKERVDALLVYVYNSLICDLESVYKTKKPGSEEIGYEGEIVTYVEENIKKWCIYKRTSGWIDLDPTIQNDKDLIFILESSLVSYSATSTTINFLQNINSTDLSYIGYVYADTIANPLLTGTIEPVTGQDVYDVYYTHRYTPGTKSLSVSLNGQRLYCPTTGLLADPESEVKELNQSTFKLPFVIDNALKHSISYVIEEPDASESSSCERYILTREDSIEGMFSTYSRNGMSLYPGNVRVFIGGYRQPSWAYKIVNHNTISFMQTLSTKETSYDLKVFDANGIPYIKKCKSIADQILIEVRQDTALREKTLPIRHTQTIWSASTDGIPNGLLKSKDKIAIYINGATYSGEYRVEVDSPDGGHIELLSKDLLLDKKITEVLGTDRIADYFEANPLEYEKWKEGNNGIGYTRINYFQNPTDFITFEWR